MSVVVLVDPELTANGVGVLLDDTTMIWAMSKCCRMRYCYRKGIRICSGCKALAPWKRGKTYPNDEWPVAIYPRQFKHPDWVRSWIAEWLEVDVTEISFELSSPSA